MAAKARVIVAQQKKWQLDKDIKFKIWEKVKCRHTAECNDEWVVKLVHVFDLKKRFRGALIGEKVHDVVVNTVWYYDVSGQNFWAQIN